MIRVAKREDAEELLKIYSYYVENTAITLSLIHIWFLRIIMDRGIPYILGEQMQGDICYRSFGLRLRIILLM